MIYKESRVCFSYGAISVTCSIHKVAIWLIIDKKTATKKGMRNTEGKESRYCRLTGDSCVVCWGWSGSTGSQWCTVPGKVTLPWLW